MVKTCENFSKFVLSEVRKRFQGFLLFFSPAKRIWSLAPTIAANYGFKVQAVVFFQISLKGDPVEVLNVITVINVIKS